MILQKLSLIFSVFLVLTITSCEKDDPEIPNEEELITTFVYTLNEVNGTGSATLRFTDLDGDGGMAPVLSSEELKANTDYTATISLLNEQESPAEVISNEVEEEGDEHQFFFSTSISDLVITYNDEDAEGNPIGLETLVKTGAAGSGTLTITLKHEPNKSAAGVKEGSIENAGGETDIEVEFNVTIL